MNKLKEDILKTRTIKDNSLNLYLSALKKLNDNDEIKSVEFLRKTTTIMKKLKELALTTQRSYLTAIIVSLTPYQDKYKIPLEFYRERLNELNNQYNDFINTNQKTEKQEKNWVELKDLIKINNKYRLELKNRNVFTKETLNNKDFDLLQKYLVSSLYVLQPPVRLNYVMKIIKDKKDDNNEDNFLYVKGKNKKVFIFNEFKTKKSHGKQEIPVNPQLNKIINIWLRHNKTKDFLLNKSGKPLTANSLGKMIPRVFNIPDKKITLNLIRHIYISSKVDIDKIKEENKKKQDLANKMMHSIGMQENYAKIE